MKSFYTKKHSRIISIGTMLMFVFSSYGFDKTLNIDNAASSAWQQVVSTESGQMTHVLLFSGNFFSWTVYKTEDGSFQLTKGGSWKKEGKKVAITYEFHTEESGQVGKTETWAIKEKGKTLRLKNSGQKSRWTSLDERVGSPLEGAWIFSGRKRDGEIQRVDMTTRPRKTMKILTENRFQWIAYNTETGQFHGTGGGTYTAVDGVYTENIKFFSRDDSRVGASLKFNFETIEGDWHHSGNNSRGEPLYELWSKRR